MAITNTRVQEIPTIIFNAVGEQAVTTIVACNVSSTQTGIFSLCAVPYGGNFGPTTLVLNNVVLPPGESFALDSERFVLSANDTFQAQANVPNVITMTISSVATS